MHITTADTLEGYRITRGPEGIYMQPHDVPGVGWEKSFL